MADDSDALYITDEPCTTVWRVVPEGVQGVEKSIFLDGKYTLSVTPSRQLVTLCRDGPLYQVTVYSQGVQEFVNLPIDFFTRFTQLCTAHGVVLTPRVTIIVIYMTETSNGHVYELSGDDTIITTFEGAEDT